MKLLLTIESSFYKKLLQSEETTNSMSSAASTYVTQLGCQILNVLFELFIILSILKPSDSTQWTRSGTACPRLAPSTDVAEICYHHEHLTLTKIRNFSIKHKCKYFKTSQTQLFTAINILTKLHRANL